MSAPLPDAAIAQFVLDETRLLNEGRYTQWLALFAEDGHYWVPVDGERQPDPINHASIAYDDALVLAIRVRRLDDARAHAMEPGVRSLHVVPAPRVEPWDPAVGLHRTVTPFVYTEVKGESSLQLTGTWCHKLRPTPDGLRIVMKRVDLLNASAAHEAIHLFP